MVKIITIKNRTPKRQVFTCSIDEEINRDFKELTNRMGWVYAEQVAEDDNKIIIDYKPVLSLYSHVKIEYLKR